MAANKRNQTGKKNQKKNNNNTRSVDKTRNTKNTQENELSPWKNPDLLRHKVIPFILVILAIFLCICFLSPSSTGVVGSFLKSFLFGVFSGGAWVMILLMIVSAFSWKEDVADNSLIYKTVLSFLILCDSSILINIFTHSVDDFSIQELYKSGLDIKSGGVIGGLLGNLLYNGFGFAGALIFSLALMAIFVFFRFGMTPLTLIHAIGDFVRNCSFGNDERRRKQLEAEQQRINQRQEALDRRVEKYNVKQEKKSARRPQRNDGIVEDLTPVDPEYDEDACNIGGASIDPEIFKDECDDSVDTQNTPAREVYSDAPPFNKEISENKEKIDLTDIFGEPEEKTENIRIPEEEYDIPSEAEIDLLIEKSKISKPAVDLDEEDEDELDAPKVEALKPTVPEEYKFPPIPLLNTETNQKNTDNSSEIRATAEKLVETLRSFNVRTKIINVSRGPTVTRYELQPEVGTKVRAIVNLVDDIALHLATSGVRIEAPIPGKEAVGIEVPNKTNSMVYIRQLIEDKEFKNAQSRVTTCLGMDVAGNPVYLDIAKMPHLLIAGTTGSGKSVCINSLIISILYKARPDEVKFILIDPKKVELGIYNGIPHLLVPVVSDPKKAAGSLHWAVTEMERRYDLIEGAGVRNIKGYNQSVANDPTAEKLPQIVIIIDELADLMMTAKDDVESSICRIAQKARAAGMHLIIGTQRPSVDVITGLIKANVPSRIAFTTVSQVDSRTIIDIAGAEKLIGRGDMLYSPVSSNKPLRVQGAFVSDDEVEAVTTFVKQNYGVKDYDKSVIETIEREAQLCGNKKATSFGDGDEEANDGDPMLRAAIELAVDCGKISTSLIQRRLQLGYGRAAKLIDIMEQMGIVSAPEGQKPRNVLITKDQFMEMEFRRSDN